MANPNIRMGLQIPLFTYPDVAPHELFERISGIAVTAEQHGFDSVWVMDHFYQLPNLGAPEEPMLEAYTDRSGSHGEPNLSPERLNALVAALVRERFTVHIHAIGDMPILPAHLYEKPGASEEEQAEFIDKNPHNRDWAGLGPYKLASWDGDRIVAKLPCVREACIKIHVFLQPRIHSAPCRLAFLPAIIAQRLAGRDPVNDLLGNVLGHSLGWSSSTLGHL